MANILKRREASSQQSFNGFDLSHRLYFTSPVGQILPIHYDKLQPKDKIRISTDMFTRLQPMNSASPITVTGHVDYFFVPYRLMFSLMPSMLADVNDWHSTLMERSFGDGLEDYPHLQLDYLFAKSFTSDELSDDIIPTVDSSFGNFDCAELGCRKLLQLLGYGDFGFDYAQNFVTQVVGEEPLIPISVLSRYYDIFNLAAYQCVWQWYYRLDTREELNRDSYNIDKYYNQVPNSDGLLPFTVDLYSFSDSNFFEGLGCLRYRPWKRDFFTSNEITPLGSVDSFSHYRNSGSNSNLLGNWIRQWLDTSINYQSNPNERNDIAVTGSFPDLESGDDATQVAWRNTGSMTDDNPQRPEIIQTTQQHRVAAVIEKLSAIWQQTGKTYKDQMEKQFGIKLGEHLSSRPIYIGSQSATLDMKPIVSDVETSEMAAGTITGYGVSNSPEKQKPIEFEAPEHGVFLALYSAVPEAVYRPTGLDFLNTYQTRADYPLPVTDELGQRPLFGFEVVNSGISEQDNSRLGWIARHQELKLKKDIRALGFDTTLAYWIPARTEQAYANDLPSYYINPNYLDDMMLVPYSGIDSILGLSYKWLDNAAFDGDPLMHFFSISCFKSTKQSTYGVPQNFFG